MSDADSPFVVPGLANLSRLIGLGELAALAGRAASLISSLPASEAPDARRVLALVQELALGGHGPPPLEAPNATDASSESINHAAPEAAGLDVAGTDAAGPADSNVARRIELRGLAERLGRRSAEGIPFASLARAASAELHGSLMDAFRIRAECDGQLLMFGL